MPSFDDFYRGRSVFVTGHTGFKGAWLTLWLTELGAQVHGYSLAPPTAPSLFVECGLESRLASHSIGDVRHGDQLAAALGEVRPEIVFHLAAQPLVRRSYREPRETFEINVLGTVNLLEAVRQTDSVRVCQVITTDKCYENREWVYAYRENDPLGGADPYSSSKACAELAVGAYRHSYFHPQEIARHGVSLASARAGNVIGGGDWAEDRIIPDCVRALEQNRPIIVRNPAAIRPWQHVLEPLSGYLLLAQRQAKEPEQFADSFNFGPASTGNVTVGQIVAHVLETWGGGAWQSPEPAADANSAGNRLHEANFLKLDITKAGALLHWRPVLSVEEAVAETIEWYRTRHRAAGNFNAVGHCLDQIRRFTEMRTTQPLALA